MMSDAIKNFASQFKYRPKIEGGKVKKYKKYVVAGMGGSPQPAQVIKALKPELQIFVHKSYGLPSLDWKSTLLIACSYSGNTEEPIDAFEHARSQNLPVVAVAIGGKLLELARSHNVPYVQIPDTKIQPRSAMGLLVCAMLKIMKQNELLKQTVELAKSLQPTAYEAAGKVLAGKLRGKVPIIYSSDINLPVAYNWKIKFNETGKIPAFYNVLPELNHNETTGFDVKDSTRQLSEKFHFIFLKDSEDHPQIQKRFDITAQLYRDRGLAVEMIELSGQNRMEKIFSSLVLGDWAAFYTAEQYGLESEQVPMVEELKKLIKKE